jgi:ATP-binding cassette subfamily B protein
MSVFFGLDKEAYDRQYTDRELLRRISGYFSPHRRYVALVGVLVAAIALIGAAQPLIVSRGSSHRRLHWC